MKLLDPLGRGEVDLHGLHLGAEALQLGRGGGQRGVLGGDDQVEVVLGELLGQLEADAAGGTGHDGEGLGHGRGLASAAPAEPGRA